MPDKDTGKRCQTCGGSVNTGGPGTITQWMFICDCQAKLLEESVESPGTGFCSICGKSKRTSRSGTLTQWIFRSDLCNCDIKDQINLPTGSIKEQKDSVYESELEPLPELELNEDILPTERYQAIKLLGQGASGSVYKCRDRLLNKIVAVKSLKLKETDLYVSFQKEAKALCLLSHPNIVKVIDFGMTGSQTPYMVMEFFEGESLEKHLMEHGPLPEPSAIELLIGIVDALEHAHHNGIFHRDLKPSNILIQKVNDTITGVMLIDFGVAAFLKESEQKDSQGNTIVGTPFYMSPDQVREKRYDKRSEVYSTGILFFEILTGRVPFQGESSLEVIKKHAEDMPPRLSEVNSKIELSEQVEDIVSCCLEKSPENRYQDMLSLKEDLLAVNSTSPMAEIVEDNSTIAGVGRRNSFKNLFLLGASGTVLLALGLGTGQYFWEQTKPRASKVEFSNSKMHTVLNRSKEFKASDSSKTSRTAEISSGDPKPESDSESQKTAAGEFTRRKMEYGLNALFASRSVGDADIKKLATREDFNALDLSRSRVTGADFDVLENKPIVYLNLSDTAINENCFSSIRKIKALNALRLERVPVNDRIIKSISKMNNLTILDLEGTGLTDSQVEMLSRLTSMNNLDISNNFSLSSKALNSLRRLKDLKILYLSNTAIDGKSLEGLLDSVPGLDSVWLLGCKSVNFKDLNRLQKKFPGRKLIRPNIIDELQPDVDDPLGKNLW